MSVYVTGDVHGNAKDMKERIKGMNSNDTLIVLGDFGAEYGTYIQGSLKKACKKTEGKILVLRGNHDNRYWRDHVKSESGKFITDDGWHLENIYFGETLVQDKYPNIHYVLDCGGLYKVENYNILMVPGAYSVDKAYRLVKGLPYEPEELLTFDERNNLMNLAEVNKDIIDFVCGHTAPLKIESYIRYLFLDFINQNSVNKTMESWLDNLMYIIEDGKKFKNYFFGHYHDEKECGQNYTMLYNSVIDLKDYC